MVLLVIGPAERLPSARQRSLPAIFTPAVDAPCDSCGFQNYADVQRARRPVNVVVAAVANKLARILWALLSRGAAYRAG